jgi:hypothetical protein
MTWVLNHSLQCNARKRRWEGQEQEAIESRMVTRRIQAVPQEIESHAASDLPADSAEHWLERHGPDPGGPRSNGRCVHVIDRIDVGTDEPTAQHVAGCRPAEGAGVLNSKWSLAPDHHTDACRRIGLFLTLGFLRLHAGVKLPQLLPQTFRVGNDDGQTVLARTLHPLAP